MRPSARVRSIRFKQMLPQYALLLNRCALNSTLVPAPLLGISNLSSQQIRANEPTIMTAQMVVGRSYVATKQEVKEFYIGKQRAVNWVKGLGHRQKTILNPFTINTAITRVAESACEEISPASPTSPTSKEATRKMLKKFKIMIDDLQNNVNAVNIATMLNRIARVSTLTGSRAFVVRDKTGLISKLSALLGAKQQALQGDVISTCLWSYSKLGPKITQVTVSKSRCVGDVIDDLFAQAQENPKGFTCQSVTDLLHAYVSLKRSPEKAFLIQLISHAKTIIEHASFRSLTRMPWYFATLKFQDDDVGIFPFIVRETETRIRAGRFDTKGLAIAVAAWGELGFKKCKVLLEIIDIEIAQSISALSEQDVVNFVTGFSKLGYLPSDSVLKKLSLVTCDARDQIGVSQLIQVVQGYACFGLRHESLMQLLKDKMREDDSELTLDDVAVACESLAILEALDGDTLGWAKSRWDGQAVGEVSEASLKRMSVAFWHGAFCNGFPQTSQVLSDRMSIDLSQLDWRHFGSNSAVGSGVIAEALALLSKQGYECHRQHKVAGSNFTAASVKHQNQPPCTVDIYDGERAFMNLPNRLTGYESWRVRVLRNAGFRVCWLDAAKWEDLASFSEKLSYVRVMLERAR